MDINGLSLEERKKYKQCNLCFKIKPLDDFYKNSFGNRGTYAHCTECNKLIYKSGRELVKAGQ